MMGYAKPPRNPCTRVLDRETSPRSPVKHVDVPSARTRESPRRGPQSRRYDQVSPVPHDAPNRVEFAEAAEVHQAMQNDRRWDRNGVEDYVQEEPSPMRADSRRLGDVTPPSRADSRVDSRTPLTKAGGQMSRVVRTAPASLPAPSHAARGSPSRQLRW